MVDWEKYRKLFPVVSNQTYFMTAGAGALPVPVRDAIIKRYMMLSLRGGRIFGDNIKIMEECREKLAYLINGEKDNIAFIPNVSFGMNALACSLSKEGSVFLSKDEFPSSVLPWENAGHLLQKTLSSADLFKKLLDNKNKKISYLVLSYVHYLNGFKFPLEDIKNAKNSINFIVNGTQGIGAFPINVKEQKIDALVCSCYKWMCCGEGISFIYIHPDLFKKLKPALVGWRSIEGAMSFNDGRKFYNSARIFELGWDNMTTFAGFNAALDLITEIGVTNISQRIIDLTIYLIDKLNKLEISLLSNTEIKHLSGIVLIGPFNQRELNKLMNVLEDRNIWVTQRGNGIRISLHYYNNEADIDGLLDVLKVYFRR